MNIEMSGNLEQKPADLIAVIKRYGRKKPQKNNPKKELIAVLLAGLIIGGCLTLIFT